MNLGNSIGERKWRNRGQNCELQTEKDENRVRGGSVKYSPRQRKPRAGRHPQSRCELGRVSKVRWIYQCPPGTRHEKNTFFFLVQKKKETLCLTRTDPSLQRQLRSKAHLSNESHTWTLQIKQSCQELIMRSPICVLLGVWERRSPAGRRAFPNVSVNRVLVESGLRAWATEGSPCQCVDSVTCEFLLHFSFFSKLHAGADLVSRCNCAPLWKWALRTKTVLTFCRLFTFCCVQGRELTEPLQDSTGTVLSMQQAILVCKSPYIFAPSASMPGIYSHTQ